MLAKQDYSWQIRSNSIENQTVALRGLIFLSREIYNYSNSNLRGVLNGALLVMLGLLGFKTFIAQPDYSNHAHTSRSEPLCYCFLSNHFLVEEDTPKTRD